MEKTLRKRGSGLLKNITDPWSVKKHIVLSLVLSIVIKMLSKFVGFSNQASSVGIIGGADGPTTIFLSSKVVGGQLFDFISLWALIILLGLYKPTKLLINKLFSR